MTVPTNTQQSYSLATMAEDLSNIVDKVGATETPFFQAVAKGEASNTYHEWAEVDLAPATDTNAVVEGDDPGTDVATTGVRLGNYTQLSDKVVQVSSTAESVDGAGDAQTLAQQVILKAQELRRDLEKQILSNKAASPGDSATARVSASMISFLRTNVSRGATGTSPTLSGITTGYPNAAPHDGTQRALTEALFKDVLQLVWENGGNPTTAFVGAYNKRVASTFTGNATRYRDADDKKVVAAVDVYVSDFGEIRLAASRNIRPRDIIIIDPAMVSIDFLQKMKQETLAKTGHSERRMISAEYTLKVRNERAHGHVADLTTSG
jgi:hypothetical protein